MKNIGITYRHRVDTPSQTVRQSLQFLRCLDRKDEKTARQTINEKTRSVRLTAVKCRSLSFDLHRQLVGLPYIGKHGFEKFYQRNVLAYRNF